ncbi:MAG: hypothetical protein HY812_08665 [Planctomycetes bacterium]|nr:hypothetical protein [Planctomycetota bacterium]
MVVDGPVGAPHFVEFVAEYPRDMGMRGFFMSVCFEDYVSIVYRDLRSPRVPDVAERAFSLFAAELDRRGFGYTVRRQEGFF